MAYTATLQNIEPVTHDVHRLTFDRPDGFDFQPGQATELAIQKDGLRDEGRPFTMTSRPSDHHLEFVIKSYPDHDGVTKEIPNLQMTDQVSLTEPFGALTDHGPGVFIAGGAGVTPFIALLRSHQEKGAAPSQLIFANETPKDIILRDMWESMAGVDQTFVVAEGAEGPLREGRIDAALLKEVVAAKDQPFYICGPGGMVDAVRDSLRDMGVAEEHIITEDGW